MVKEMKDQYKKYTEEIKTKMIEAWKQWRFSLVEFEYGRRRRYVGTLLDDLLDKYMIIRSHPKPWDDPGLFRSVELQYERYLFANELVPMVKPFLLLLRIVPGRDQTFDQRSSPRSAHPWSMVLVLCWRDKYWG